MNRLTLKNLYPEIRPWERIRLLLAADKRHDQVEYQRLFHASPIKTWYFSEHLMAELALHVLTLEYITDQLDTAATLFMALFHLSHHPDEKDHLEKLTETCAYAFTCNCQGWKAFCDDLKLDSEMLVRGNNSGHILAQCEQFISSITLSTEELLQAGFIEKALLPQELTRRWHQQMREMVRSTPIEGTEVSS